MFGIPTPACKTNHHEGKYPGIHNGTNYLHILASFPGPPSFPSLALQLSGRGPGKFYHEIDVKGSMNVGAQGLRIARRAKARVAYVPCVSIASGKQLSYTPSVELADG